MPNPDSSFKMRDRPMAVSRCFDFLQGKGQGKGLGNVRRSLLMRILGFGSAVASSLMVAVAIAPTVSAANSIRAHYGPIQLSISVESLERFADEGVINPDLQAYANRLSDQELVEVRRLLQSSADVDPVAIANFLYTAQGEAILERVGGVIRTRSSSGFYALRAALILAASHEDGATPLGLLKEFPTDSIVIDVDRGLKIVRELDQLINVTSEALSLVETQFNKDVANINGISLRPAYELSRLGPYLWEQTTLPLQDKTRDRDLPLDLYLPNVDAPAPLVVISHGLGSDRTSYRYVAEHLASRGFAVAALDHPGSNANYIQALFEGASEQISEPEEFINRPRDISFVLDELTRLAATDAAFRNRMNLDQVGVIGQSFGGFTALSIAGAEINLERLQRDCPSGSALQDTLNLSLLLQCRARNLNPADLPDPISLKDDRVKAALAINPISSIVFGSEGMAGVDVPVMIVSGSSDVIAPSLMEQLFPFAWLNVSDRYLVVMRKGTHFSTIGLPDDPANSVELPPAIIGPDPALAQTYTKILSTAFFSTHVAEQPAYQEYLSPSYIRAISREPLPLSIVESLNAEQLTQMVKDTSLLISILD
ncbi:MAG: alpha/beta hydrolase [Elainellaceae cyanobacterium]